MMVSRYLHVAIICLYQASEPSTVCAISQVQQMSRFQLCSDCYHSEQAALVAGAQTRLPAGITLGALVAEPVEHVPPTGDEGNPLVESEFFDTRQAFLSLCQVRSASLLTTPPNAVAASGYKCNAWGAQHSRYASSDNCLQSKITTDPQRTSRKQRSDPRLQTTRDVVLNCCAVRRGTTTSSTPFGGPSTAA